MARPKRTRSTRNVTLRLDEELIRLIEGHIRGLRKTRSDPTINCTSFIRELIMQELGVERVTERYVPAAPDEE